MTPTHRISACSRSLTRLAQPWDLEGSRGVYVAVVAFNSYRVRLESFKALLLSIVRLIPCIRRNSYDYSWLQHPLVDVKAIKQRQAMVQIIYEEKALMNTLQKGSGMLRGMPGDL